MRTTSIKSTYLTKEELQRIIFDYIATKDYGLAKHLMDNRFEMELTANDELQIALDGEFEDKQ